MIIARCWVGPIHWHHLDDLATGARDLPVDGAAAHAVACFEHDWRQDPLTSRRATRRANPDTAPRAYRSDAARPAEGCHDRTHDQAER
jgi:hypothetical protein